MGPRQVRANSVIFKWESPPGFLNHFLSLNWHPGGTPRKRKIGWRCADPLPKTLTLFMTKICDFSYPIYDLTKNLIPYGLVDNDEKVTNSKKTYPIQY